MSTTGDFDLLVPGPLDQRTGGYLYDARIVDELRAAGWTIRVHELGGRHPEPDEQALRSMGEALAGTTGHGAVVVDGLALPALAAWSRGERGGTDARGEVPGGGSSVPAHARPPVIGLVHHPVSDETGLPDDVRARLNDLEIEALSACSGAIVTSRFTAERVAEGFGVPAERIRVVLPGTEVTAASDPPHTLSSAPLRILCVGSIVPRKGQDLLVEALARVSKSAEVADVPEQRRPEGPPGPITGWTCVFVGSLERDAAYARDVQDRVRAEGLEDRVTFAGELDTEALDRLYRTSSIFVLPSHYEGYGMALAEAIAHALPIVSTTGGAIPYTVPEDAGLLVTPGDVRGLADALASVLRDADLRGRLAAGARRCAGELPTWTESARIFGAAVRDLTAGPRVSYGR